MLAGFALVFSPGAVSARSKGEKVSRAPETNWIYNSQTMDLLEGYHNINPTGVGGPELAIVDEMALENLSKALHRWLPLAEPVLQEPLFSGIRNSERC